MKMKPNQDVRGNAKKCASGYGINESLSRVTELITKPVQPSPELFIIDIEKAPVLSKVAPSEYGTSRSSLLSVEALKRHCFYILPKHSFAE